MKQLIDDAQSNKSVTELLKFFLNFNVIYIHRSNTSHILRCQLNITKQLLCIHTKGKCAWVIHVDGPTYKSLERPHFVDIFVQYLSTFLTVQTSNMSLA